MAEETTRNEKYDLFYRTYREKPELILLNRETGEITSVELPAWEEPYWVSEVYLNDQGQVMLFPHWVRRWFTVARETNRT